MKTFNMLISKGNFKNLFAVAMLALSLSCGPQMTSEVQYEPESESRKGRIDG